eukprot:scpid45213/ scgid9027/ Dual oxidase
MRAILLLALAATAWSQRILFDDEQGECVSDTFDTSPLKFDFQLDAASIAAIIAATPGGSIGRNVEGFGIAVPTASNSDTSVSFGARGRTLRRLTPNAYADNLDVPRGTCLEDSDGNFVGVCLDQRANKRSDGTFAGSNLPNPRTISEVVSTSTGVIASRRNLHDLTGHFGQFLAHDTTLVPEGGPDDQFDIVVPEGDPVFDPEGTGEQLMGFRRAIRELRCTGSNPRGTLIPPKSPERPREHNNEISSFIDATMIYGGTNGREALLRSNSPSRPGQLSVSAGNLLPFNNFPPSNDANQDNPRGVPNGEQFFGGDVRTNEAPGLSLLITIFVREHNRLAKHHAIFLKKLGKVVKSDVVFAWAKNMLIAELQNIAYNEWLPALFGEEFEEFTAHDPTIQPDLFAEFSAATRRFGHSLINGFIPVVLGFNKLRGCHRADLATHLFNTVALINRQDGGIEPILRGILCIRSQQMDTVVTPGLQQRLFAAEEGEAERDLVALNIMRGREHGIAGYNEIRVALGLEKLTKFSEINPADPELVRRLVLAYGGNIDNIDLFIGALAEAPAAVEHGEGHAEFGETLRAMFKLQFRNIRNSDSRFFSLAMTSASKKMLPSFGDIIRRNSRVYPANLFPSHSIFFHPLFCRAVREFQCVPRSNRKEHLFCDKVYELPDLANSTQPTHPSQSFPWRLAV